MLQEFSEAKLVELQISPTGDLDKEAAWSQVALCYLRALGQHVLLTRPFRKKDSRLSASTLDFWQTPV